MTLPSQAETHDLPSVGIRRDSKGGEVLTTDLADEALQLFNDWLPRGCGVAFVVAAPKTINFRVAVRHANDGDMKLLLRAIAKACVTSNVLTVDQLREIERMVSP